ncbi:MAG: class I SAM-dependent methyltransferase, partial [Bacteroidales bacterium]|nr:class I SAM-dependent methyltransferase [Bacteroidales bacterium]
KPNILSQLKMELKKIILRIPIISHWKRLQQKRRFKGSVQYWEKRYQEKGNSGSGSYERLADFKAEILNEFVRQNQIRTVLEFGCGDGNQLTLAEYPRYTGLDVSPTAIIMCVERFRADASKSFFIYDSLAFHDAAGIFRAELVLSLDVLFHLVELEIFESYLKHLFQSAQKYVIIYASDFDQDGQTIYRHEKRRSFTTYVASQFPDWKLKEVIKNKFPVEKFGNQGSLSDFFIYEKL